MNENHKVDIEQIRYTCGCHRHGYLANGSVRGFSRSLDKRTKVRASLECRCFTTQYLMLVILWELKGFSYANTNAGYRIYQSTSWDSSTWLGSVVDWRLSEKNYYTLENKSCYDQEAEKSMKDDLPLWETEAAQNINAAEELIQRVGHTLADLIILAWGNMIGKQ